MDFVGSPPPPPPPGGLPPPPEFKPVVIKIPKKSSHTVEAVAVKVNVPKPQEALIQEIKGGVMLRKTEGPVRGRSATVSPMLAGQQQIGMLAAQMAKERQSRMQAGNARQGPIRSKRLDRILDKF